MYRKVVVLSILRLLLQNIYNVLCNWIDPDTNITHHTTKPHTKSDKRQYKLVFSDEFNTANRTFHDGHDPKWTSLDKNDYTNDALHYYSSDNVRTTNGVLNITTTLKTNKYIALDEKTRQKYVDEKHIQSAMVQGWNKFCYTGGIIEISAKLPGSPKIGGLWPALWLLGNLARGTYVGSSDYVWPWSYDTCSDKIRVSQEINACDKVSHYGLKEYEGRGSPEIDILEAMGGESGPLPNTHIQRPYFSSSLQVAPGISNYRPHLGSLPRDGFWYDNLEYGNETNSDLNPFFYGVTLIHKPKSYTYQSDALSANMMINTSHFTDQHVYRVEWEPPTNSTSDDGYIRWYADSNLVYGITSNVLTKSGTIIPNEPMYILLNTAVSTSWGFQIPCPEGCDCDCYQCGNPDCTCGFPEGFCDINIPSSFEIDYVRVYQAVNEPKHEIGCSTERKPTELFIMGHKERYKNKEDKEPLKPVLNGTGSCNTHRDCGGKLHGKCINKICSCTQNYTGPYCLAHYGYNDHPYHIPIPTIHFTRMIFPKNLLLILFILAFMFATVILINSSKRKLEKDHYFSHDSYYVQSPPSSSFYYVNDYNNKYQEKEQSLKQSFQFNNYHDDNYNDSNASYTTDLRIPPLYSQQNDHDSYNEHINFSVECLGHQYSSLSQEGTPLLQHIHDSDSVVNRGKVISYCVIDERLIND